MPNDQRYFFDELHHYGNRVAFLTEHYPPCTYVDVVSIALALSHWIKKRPLVFLIANNSLGSVLGYIACLRSRAVTMLLPDNTSAERLRNLQNCYQPQFLLAPMDHPILTDDYKPVFHFYDTGLYQLATQYQSLHIELAQLLSTSGSTGSPKFVRQSYQNITTNATAIASYLRITKEDRPITTLPMSYTYGLSIILSHLTQGASILLTDRSVVEKEFWNLFSKYSATSFGGVPYLFEILKKIRFLKMNLPSLRTVTQAGGAMHPDLIREFSNIFAQRGIDFYVMYGQTEATARMSFYQPILEPTKVGSIGKSIYGGSFFLMDEYDAIIQKDNTIGELVYRGPNVMLGYAQSHRDLAMGDDLQGVLKTGDLACRDADGYYYITGRKKRFIKLYGHRINLDEVEQFLHSLAIEDCAVMGSDQILQIYVTKLIEDAQFTQSLAEELGIHKSAIQIFQVSRIPRNLAGKVLYDQLPFSESPSSA
jgi:acyl-coenzyme A synthetase/AMP-(fatty) acid ligase